jgi:hypothetical protein
MLSTGRRTRVDEKYYFRAAKLSSLGVKFVRINQEVFGLTRIL